MDNACAVMEAIHQEIQTEYRLHGSIRHNCYLTALEIAQSLIVAESRNPEIREYHLLGGKPGDGMKFNANGYENDRPFKFHMVCVCDGLVFDPLYRRAIPEKDYPRELTKHPLEHRVEESARSLQGLFKTRLSRFFL